MRLPRSVQLATGLFNLWLATIMALAPWRGHLVGWWFPLILAGVGIWSIALALTSRTARDHEHYDVLAGALSAAVADIGADDQCDCPHLPGCDDDDAHIVVDDDEDGSVVRVSSQSGMP